MAEGRIRANGIGDKPRPPGNAADSGAQPLLRRYVGIAREPSRECSGIPGSGEQIWFERASP